jgi:hypothetical protein
MGTGGELTHSQQQIWVGQRLAPGSPLYNMAFAFIFPAGLKIDVFRQAWQRVADGSDALRTRIVATATLDCTARPRNAGRGGDRLESAGQRVP